MRLPDREREGLAFRLLRDLGQGEFVLIGGYAVSAHGPPRFSVDLDMVLESSEVPKVQDVLRERGLSAVKTWDGGEVFAGRAERWALDPGALPIAVDMLIDGVHDRVSGASFSYRDIRGGSSRLPLRGLDPSAAAEARVADRETLVALKLAAGRKVDLRDIAILAGSPLDVGRIRLLLDSADRQILLDHVQTLEFALSTRDFSDSLKGVYMLEDRAFTLYREGARRLCLRLRASLEPP